MDDEALFQQWLRDNTPVGRAYSITDLRHGFMAALALKRREAPVFNPYPLWVSSTLAEAVLIRSLLGCMYSSAGQNCAAWHMADELRDRLVTRANNEGRYEFKY
jgi:hypothetical protein